MDDFQICNRVHTVFDVHDICVVECTAHMHDAVHFLDVGQEGISQALASGCPPAPCYTLLGTCAQLHWQLRQMLHATYQTHDKK